MSDSDSDDDLLANLLANANDSEPKCNETNTTEQLKSDELEKSIDNDCSKQSKHTTLKELEFNFLDVCGEDFDEPFKLPTEEKSTTLNKSISLTKKSEDLTISHGDNGDSSDEEDKKYFEQQRYSEYGREIKHLIKNKESEKESLLSGLRKENSFSASPNNIKSTPTSNRFKSNVSSPSSNNLDKKNDKYSLQIQTNPGNSVKKDVYSDPIFGLRMINPLVSSTDLVEKMQGRKPVTISGVKVHLMNKSMGLLDEDWVIAGVLLSKSPPRTSQKGSQYCIWKISDLSADMNTVSVFLFSHAYKQFWKLSEGSVIGILNPSVLECKDQKDLATLSVDIAQKIMVMGTSKDLGKCKSLKKNGEPCSAPINLRNCEYCVYHVKKEYGKFSKRSDLQSEGFFKKIGLPNNTNKNKYMQQRHPEAAPFIAIPAKRNEAQYKKDCERLALLRGEIKPVQKIKEQPKVEAENKLKGTSVEISIHQMKKDAERLNKLRKQNNDKILTSPSTQDNKKTDFKLSFSPPKLGKGMKGGFIDLSEPTPKNFTNNSKLNAIEWVKRNGSIKKTNPNKIRPSKEVMSEKGIKRRREEEESETRAEKIAKKEEAVKSKFQEMLEMKSAHSDLIDKRENEETELYFKKLEAKERMEEKMLTTFKVPCKAVRCPVCKYVAFSSSDLCKKMGHPIRVIDAEKRFFKCGDCGNRTISLDRIPTETCKRCSSSKWIKTGMMDEKKTELDRTKLCIRGAEEKFIGSSVSAASLDLLVPECD